MEYLQIFRRVSLVGKIVVVEVGEEFAEMRTTVPKWNDRRFGNMAFLLRKGRSKRIPENR